MQWQPEPSELEKQARASYLLINNTLNELSGTAPDWVPSKANTSCSKVRSLYSDALQDVTGVIKVIL